jgi:hypothetical protein
MGLANQGKTPGRTTLLEAVNICLTNIGEQPVSSLDNEQVQDARIAEATLLEVHKEGQTRGWTWNTEESFIFEKDKTTHEIVLPANVVSWAPDQYEWAGRLTLRGQRVYDRQTRSYQFDETINEVQADVVWLLPWDETPEAYNRWATVRGARIFSDRTLASDAIFKYTAKDEQDALAELLSVENDEAKPNILTGGFNPFPTYRPGMGLVGRVGGGLRLG